ncbi:MAG: MBL fold metallo-hydrolase [Alphaproteobacteria bacterium]|nr:MBL fold metallo-hydrolase [Alphaproteobacteria bacterium]
MTGPKEFSVTLLGTGCPNVSPRRYGAGQLVRAGGLTVLVDIGSGVTQRLVEAGSHGAEIDALLITHIHSDHLVDLYQFIISSWHQNRDRPQVIYGPPGTKAFVGAQMAAWQSERELRIEFEKRTSTAAFEIDVREFDSGGILIEKDGVTVSAVRVDHDPVEYAFGFVFERAGRKLVLSGDTRPSDALIDAARGADVLVHEVFQHGRSRQPGGTRSSETIAQVESYHTLSTVVGGIAHRAAVGALILTHLVPPDADPDALLDDARQGFDGFVAVGEDLMRIDVARRRVTWRQATVAF